MEIEKILEERGNRYGSFEANARVAQGLKAVMFKEIIDNNRNVPDNQIEALELIFTKISRIITGDFTWVDNWHDISGYATLIAKELRKQNVTS